MIGYVLSFLHNIREAFRTAITPGLDAYEDFQRGFDDRIAEARVRHGKVRVIEAERRAKLHEALRGGL